MTGVTLDSFLALTPRRRGHFRLESGYHTDLWLDLDSLFATPDRVAPFVARLTEALRSYHVDLVCGPVVGGARLAQLIAESLEVDFCFAERVTADSAEGLYAVRYRLPPLRAASVEGRRVALVDDVVSAGSAVKATCDALRAAGSSIVAAGALLVLGQMGQSLLASEGIPVEAVFRREFSLWSPSDCRLCAAGQPLESPV
jgi:orotate phosphoribosyltransferase